MLAKARLQKHPVLVQECRKHCNVREFKANVKNVQAKNYTNVIKK